MKNLFVIAAMTAMFALVSCGNGTKEEPKTDTTSVTVETVDTVVPASTNPESEPATVKVEEKEETPVTNTTKPVRGN